MSIVRGVKPTSQAKSQSFAKRNSWEAAPLAGVSGAEPQSRRRLRRDNDLLDFFREKVYCPISFCNSSSVFTISSLASFISSPVWAAKNLR